MLFNEGFLFLYSVGYKPPLSSNYRIFRPTYINCLVENSIIVLVFYVVCQMAQSHIINITYPIFVSGYFLTYRPKFTMNFTLFSRDTKHTNTIGAGLDCQ